MDKKEIDIENVSTFRDSLLMSLIFSNIGFIIIFLLCFLKTNTIIKSFKFAFGLSCIIFIGACILIYIYLDIVLENRIKEINDFNELFVNTQQQILEERQNKILEKIYSYADEYDDNDDDNDDNNVNNIKKSNSNVKTQFNLDFEDNIQDLSNKMDT